MELKLKNGDYIPDGAGGFVRCTGAEALLAEALFRLTCRRGSFPLLPDLGSRMHELTREKPGAIRSAARQWAIEALQDMDLTVTDVTVRTTGHDLAEILVHLTAAGQRTTLEVTI